MGLWAFSDGRNISFVIVFHKLAFGVQTFQALIRGSAQTTYKCKVFPRTAVGKLRGLSITDAQWCMPVWKAWAISGSENKVKLSSTSSIAFERSSLSNDQRAPRIEQNSILKHLWTTILPFHTCILEEVLS